MAFNIKSFRDGDVLYADHVNDIVEEIQSIGNTTDNLDARIIGLERVSAKIEKLEEELGATTETSLLTSLRKEIDNKISKYEKWKDLATYKEKMDEFDENIKDLQEDLLSIFDDNKFTTLETHLKNHRALENMYLLDNEEKEYKFYKFKWCWDEDGFIIRGKVNNEGSPVLTYKPKDVNKAPYQFYDYLDKDAIGGYEMVYPDFNINIEGGYTYKFELQFPTEIKDKTTNQVETISVAFNDENKLCLGVYVFNEYFQNYITKEEKYDEYITSDKDEEQAKNGFLYDQLDIGWGSADGFEYEIPYFLNGSKTAGIRFVIKRGALTFFKGKEQKEVTDYADIAKIMSYTKLKIYQKPYSFQKFIKQKDDSKEPDFTLMSFNVGNYGINPRDASYHPQYTTTNLINGLIHKYSPDIICFQEDRNSGEDSEGFPVREFKNYLHQTYREIPITNTKSVIDSVSENEKSDYELEHISDGAKHPTLINKYRLDFYSYYSKLFSQTPANTEVEGSTEKKKWRYYQKTKFSYNGQIISIYNVHFDYGYAYGPWYDANALIKIDSADIGTSLGQVPSSELNSNNEIPRYLDCWYRSLKALELREILTDIKSDIENNKVAYWMIVGDFNTLYYRKEDNEYRGIIEKFNEEIATIYKNDDKKPTWANDFNCTWFGDFRYYQDPENPDKDKVTEGGFYDRYGEAQEITDHVILSPGLKLREVIVDYTNLQQSKNSINENWIMQVDHLPLIVKFDIEG